MSVLIKEIVRHYMKVSEAKSVEEYQGDLAYFTDATPAGWFKCVELESAPSLNADMIQGRGTKYFWQRLGTEETGPGITDLIPKTYAENVEVKKGELVVLDNGLYTADSTHTATADNVTNKDELTAVSSNAVASGDPVARSYVAGEEYVENELVRTSSGLAFATAHTATADNVTNLDAVELVDTQIDRLVSHEYTDGDDLSAGEVFRYSGSLYFSPSVVNGSTPGSMTWAEIESSMILVAQVAVTPTAAFDIATNYAQDDEVVFDGFKWTCKVGGHAAGAFDVANWTRSVSGGLNRGAFSTSSVYLVGDKVEEAGLEYVSKSDQNAGSFDQSKWTRVTIKFFEGLPVSQDVLVGDTVFVDQLYLYCKTAYTAGAADAVADVLVNYLVLSEEGKSELRDYATDGVFGAGEMIQHLEGIYYVKTDFDGSTTPTVFADVLANNLIVVKEPSVAPVPEHSDTATYAQNDEVMFDGIKWKAKADITTPTAFTVADWESVDKGTYRGLFDTNKTYAEDDEVMYGGLRYFFYFDTDAGAWDASNVRRLTPRHFTSVTEGYEYVINDFFYVDNKGYVAEAAFTLGSGETLDDHPMGAFLFSDDSKSNLRDFDPNALFEAKELIHHNDGVFYVHTSFDGSATPSVFEDVLANNLIEIKPATTVVYPEFVPSTTYEAGDRVTFQGKTWENYTGSSSSDFLVGDWAAISEPIDRGPFHIDNVYGAGDIITFNGHTYTANADRNHKPFNRADFTRISTDLFDPVYPNFAYIPGDILRIDGGTYQVIAGFEIDPAETIADHLDKVFVLSNDDYSKLRTYTDGDSIEAATMFVYNGAIYYTSSEIDGTLTNSDTWEEIKTRVTLVADLGTIYPEFDSSTVYAENDKVTYKGFIFTRNAEARVPNDPFSLTHFDRDIPAGYDHGEFVANIPYLAGDIVMDDGIKYAAFSSQANIAAFSEGSVDGKFERISPQEFIAYPALATRFIVGDKLYLDKRSFYVKNEFTSADGDTIDAHLTNLHVISDDLVNVTRTYVDGDSFQSGEFLTYDSNLYFVDTSWTADLTPGSETNHVWSAVSSNCTLVSSVAAVTPIPFDKTETYAENTLVSFMGMLYTRNATVRPASAEFSLDHFNRNLPGGVRRGAPTANEPYLAGDILTIGGKDYRVNENVDFNVNDDTTWSEAITGAATYIRINPEIFTTLENEKVYINKDYIIDDSKTYIVTGAFKTAAVATLEGEANVTLLSNDKDVLVPTYDETFEYVAGMQFKLDQVLYFVHTDFTAAGTIDTQEDNIVAISNKPLVAPVAFDQALAYNEGDRVNFQGFVWVRNATPRTPSTPFSITEFDREPVSTEHIERGEFAAGEHLLTGDSFLYEGIEYLALADKDVTTDTLADAWAAFSPNAKRVGNMSFTEFTADTEYVKNDIFRVDLRTYIAQVDFTSGADLDLDTYAELILLTEDDRSVISEYENGDSIEAGEMVRFDGVVYVAPEAIDGTVDLNWTTVKPKLAVVVKLPVPIFEAANTYAENDKVIFKGYEFVKNATARAGGEAFTLNHFDRVLAGGEDMGTFDADQVYLAGDTFTLTTTRYSADVDKEPGVDWATFQPNVTRITPLVFASLVPNRSYIVGDTVEFADYDMVINTAFDSDADPVEAEIAVNADIVNIKEKYFLAADDAITYHDYQKKGHIFIVEGDYTVELFSGYMPKKGDRLVLNGDKTSVDTAELSHFDLFLADKIVEEVVAPAFDAAATYSEGDLVTYEGMVYARNAAVRAANDPFSIAHFDREDTTPQEFRISTEEELEKTVALIGDVIYFRDTRTVALVNKDVGEKFIYDKTKFTRLGVSTLYATEEDFGKTDMLPGDIIIHAGNTYFTRYEYTKAAVNPWGNFFNNEGNLRNFIVLGTALISDYTIEGRVKLGTEPGAVVAPGDSIPFRDRTVVDWDVTFVGITISAIVEATLNGVDITSEIEADSTNNVFKLKAGSTLEIFADDLLVFHFDI